MSSQSVPQRVPEVLLPSATPQSSLRSQHHQGLCKATTRGSEHAARFGGVCTISRHLHDWGESLISISEHQVQQKSFSARSRR